METVQEGNAVRIGRYLGRRALNLYSYLFGNSDMLNWSVPHNPYWAFALTERIVGYAHLIHRVYDPHSTGFDPLDIITADVLLRTGRWVMEDVIMNGGSRKPGIVGTFRDVVGKVKKVDAAAKKQERFETKTMHDSF